MPCRYKLQVGEICGRPYKHFNTCGIHKKHADNVSRINSKQQKKLYYQFVDRYILLGHGIT